MARTVPYERHQRMHTSTSRSERTLDLVFDDILHSRASILPSNERVAGCVQDHELGFIAFTRIREVF